MRSTSPLPDPLLKGPFLVRDAMAAGVGRGRLRASDLGRPFWGARIPTCLEPDFAASLAAAALVMSPDEVFSHDTSARLLELPLPRPWTREEPIHITGPSADPRCRRRGIIAHRGLEVRGTQMRHGFACTDLVTTWADLAASLALDDLIALGDGVVNWRRGVPLSALTAEVANRERRRGARAMRQALPWMRTRSDSAYETKARLLFVRGGLPEPELNAAVCDEAGGWLGTGDLVWKRQMVVAEFDGDFHRTRRRRWQNDVGRREAIEDAGWHYVQMTAADVDVPHKAKRKLESVARLLGIMPLH